MKQLFHFLFCLVFILPTSAQTWTHDTLIEDLNTSNVASIGNKIFFYSGVKQVGSSQLLSDQLEIFDIQTGTKQVSTLPSGAPRYGSGVTVVGSKVMFAGG
ncbi:MAG: hypothetical protein JWO58_2115, partial [Chitinophagaceae bacterium]|nr:hypothetical protein [Chitinophagaceae bacterium]